MKNRIFVLSITLLLFGSLLGAGSSMAAPPGGRYIVVFHDTVDVNTAVPAVAQAHGLQVGFVYQHALKGMSAIVPEGRLNALQNDPRVNYVVQDMLRTIDAQTVPTGVQR
ncbi:MAG TPA: hypothetical protein VMN57_16455, partial [Anaerolineales bacterium]|nr:hypothetical protein [Anaerolineales bacterium]